LNRGGLNAGVELIQKPFTEDSADRIRAILNRQTATKWPLAE